MNQVPKQNSDASGTERVKQRKQLANSEREAKKNQPENYQEEAVESKIVSTEQSNPDQVGSIKGLDNKRA